MNPTEEILTADFEMNNSRRSCMNCQTDLICHDESQVCATCGMIYESSNLKIEEYFRNQPRQFNMNRLFWATQQYDPSFARDYQVRRYINELSQKMDFPESMRIKTEALAKNILSQNSSLSKNLKWICFVCAFLQFRSRDPSFSIKNFCQRLGIRAKSIMKHLNEIKQYINETPQNKTSLTLKSEISKDEEKFNIFLEQIDFSEIINDEASLAISVLNMKQNIKELNISGNNQFTQIEQRFKEKIRKYGVQLLRSEKIYPIKFGIKLENYIASIIYIVCRALKFPVTIKKLANSMGVSHIAISRLKKEISFRIMNEYFKSKNNNDNDIKDEICFQNLETDEADESGLLKKALKCLYNESNQIIN